MVHQQKVSFFSLKHMLFSGGCYSLFRVCFQILVYALFLCYHWSTWSPGIAARKNLRTPHQFLFSFCDCHSATTDLVFCVLWCSWKRLPADCTGCATCHVYDCYKIIKIIIKKKTNCPMTGTKRCRLSPNNLSPIDDEIWRRFEEEKSKTFGGKTLTKSEISTSQPAFTCPPHPPPPVSRMWCFGTCMQIELEELRKKQGKNHASNDRIRKSVMSSFRVFASFALLLLVAV